MPATRATLAASAYCFAVSWPEIRRFIPNALTIARFIAIPVFVWLYLEAGDGAAWGAGIFFAAAALTDQVDGYLARRWHVESRFGTVADPLADRLMIGTAALLMLGLLYARYLNRPDKAAPLLEQAVGRLRNPRDVELAKEELAKITGTAAR